MNASFRPDIHGLRAIAVVSVVLFHFRFGWFAGGFVGVDVFFVISGYLMSQIILERLNANSFSVLAFYASRCRRIVPALALLLAALLVLGWLTFPPADYQTLAANALYSLLFVSNLRYASTAGYFNAASQENWLLHTWSLSVEWQFYLLFPLALVALHKLSRKYGVVIGIWVVFAASLAWSFRSTNLSPTVAYFHLPGRAWELLAGALVYLHADHLKRHSWLAAVGVLLIGWAVFTYSATTAFPGVAAVVPVLGSALVLGASSSSRWLCNRVMTFIGNISYSAYLWHWPIWMAIEYFNLPIGNKGLGAAMLLVGLMAYISYCAVERPARRQTSPPDPARNWAVAGAAAAVLTTATLVVNDHGFPQRLPEHSAATILKNQAMAEDWKLPASCDQYEVVFQRLTAQSPCTIVANGQHKTLFWGDSHMAQYYPAIQGIVSSEAPGEVSDAVFAIYSGCIPVRGFNRIEPGFTCNEINERFFRLAQSPEVSKVVIASNWIYYLGEADRGRGAPTRICEAAKCPVEPDRARIEAAVMARLIQDIKTLTASGKEVFIVEAMPVTLRNAPLALARAQFLGYKLQIGEKADQFRTRTEPIRALLGEVSRQTGAILLDPGAVLCSESECRYEVNGVSLYHDAAHFSTAGSAYFEHMFAPALTR